MGDEDKERRCKTCGKLLLDEKLPFCKRCVMVGRNKVGQIGGLAVGLITTGLSAAALIEKNSPDDDEDDDEDYD